MGVASDKFFAFIGRVQALIWIWGAGAGSVVTAICLWLADHKVVSAIAAGVAAMFLTVAFLAFRRSKPAPNAGGPTSGPPLIPTMLRDCEVRLSDWVAPDRPTICGVTFERCTLRGPLVLALKGCTILRTAAIGVAPGDQYVIIGPGGAHLALGIVEMVGCRFVDCKFIGLGLAGSPAEVAAWKEAQRK